ncbi:Lrp/AsnC family transcriptional regulator [Nitrospirillum sp. BR 11752]|uniref:Lrp/AsnC family transcriptional regulator n=1 Tax=Nitrospirillum sp. BR 11752 TaxID=3104293 RepID=UPI002E9D4679|nr:Lrp/AsnC family transcriptional regulator [Nitrospirillum sp. BR 11752]
MRQGLRTTVLDRIDRAILTRLQEHGRIPNSELAAHVHLSESACLRRVKAMEEAGIISGYTAILDPASCGRPESVFVQVTLEKQTEPYLRAFEEALATCPQVMECYLMSGDSDYLLRVVVAGAADYEALHNRILTRLPGVARVHSSFTLRTVMKRTALPLADVVTVGGD